MITSNLLVDVEDFNLILDNAATEYESLKGCCIFDDYIVQVMQWMVVLYDPYKVIAHDDPNLNKTCELIETTIGLYYLHVLTVIGKNTFARIRENLTDLSDKDELSLLELAREVYKRLPKSVDMLDPANVIMYSSILVNSKYNLYGIYVTANVPRTNFSVSAGSLLGSTILTTYLHMAHLISTTVNDSVFTIESKLKDELTNIVSWYRSGEVHIVLGCVSLVETLIDKLDIPEQKKQSRRFNKAGLKLLK